MSEYVNVVQAYEYSKQSGPSENPMKEYLYCNLWNETTDLLPESWMTNLLLHQQFEPSIKDSRC